MKEKGNLPMDPKTGIAITRIARGVTYLVYAYTIIVLVILVLGFFLLLFGANPDVAFTEWAYRNLDRVMAPFRGIFEDVQLTGDSVLDTSVIFAMIVYSIVALFLHALIDWLTQRLLALACCAPRSARGNRRARARPGVTGCRLTYVGHATVLVEMDGARLLTDPLLRARIAHVRRRVPLPALDQLRDLDAVLISHAPRRPPGRAVAAPARPRRIGDRAARVGEDAAARGLHAVTAMVPGERRQVGAVTVEAVEAEHDGRRRPLGKPVPALSFLFEGPVNIYFAGDTDLFDGMAELRGRVDVALLPIWGWGPRLPAGHLGPETAARALSMIRPALAIPIHWGTMRSPGERSAHDSRAPADAFAAAVARVAAATEVRILAPGEATEVRAAVAPVSVQKPERSRWMSPRRLRLVGLLGVWRRRR